MKPDKRVPDYDRSELSEAQAAVYDRIATGPRGDVVGPLRVWVQNPDLAERAQALGQYARYDSSLSPALSELAILVTARIWSSGFEWAQHAPIALNAGLSEATISDISHGTIPTLREPAQSAVFEFAVELHRDRRVSEGTYKRAFDLLGQTAVIDLVGICGYYTLISMTINAFDVPGGDGPVLPAISTPPENMFR